MSAAVVGGVEQPAVAAAIARNRPLRSAGMFGVAVLDQPLEAIDRALRRHSGGRSAIHFPR